MRQTIALLEETSNPAHQQVMATGIPGIFHGGCLKRPAAIAVTLVEQLPLLVVNLPDIQHHLDLFVHQFTTHSGMVIRQGLYGLSSQPCFAV
mgnify:FL=1